MSNTANSGIVGYVYTKTSISIKFHSGDIYRYDLSESLEKGQLETMIALAKAGKGLNGYLNANPLIKKYGYIDTTLKNSSFHSYVQH